VIYVDIWFWNELRSRMMIHISKSIRDGIDDFNKKELRFETCWYDVWEWFKYKNWSYLKYNWFKICKL